MSYVIKRTYLVQLQEDPPLYLKEQSPGFSGYMSTGAMSDAYPYYTPEAAAEALQDSRRQIEDMGLEAAFDARGPEVVCVPHIHITGEPEPADAASSDQDVLHWVDEHMQAWIEDAR